jgi:membrane protease YdiL (CAAX protease family)
MQPARDARRSGSLPPRVVDGSGRGSGVARVEDAERPGPLPTRTADVGRQGSLPARAADGLVLLAWAASTVLVGVLPDAAYQLVGSLLAVGAVAAAAASGLGREGCFLRVAWPSRGGLAAGLGYAALASSAVFPTGTFVGFDPVGLFVLAPVSGVAQELLFRAALLPVLLRAAGAGGRRVAAGGQGRGPAVDGRVRVALVLQAVLFAAWHVLPALDAPLGGFVAVLVVTFIGGIAWGWAVLRDGTVAWVMAIHVAMLMVMSFFTWA